MSEEYKLTDEEIAEYAKDPEARGYPIQSGWLTDDILRHIKDILDAQCAKFQPLLDQLETDKDELQLVFDLRYKADQRAIKMWRLGHPERQLTLPDHADLVVWLLEKIAEQDKEIAHLKKLVKLASESFNARHEAELAGLPLTNKLQKGKAEVQDGRI